MSVESVPTIEDDIKTVTEAFLAGRPIPPDVGARIEERAADIREQVFQEHGYLNIAVPLTRESREAGH
jgi:hypothetical protein